MSEQQLLQDQSAYYKEHPAELLKLSPAQQLKLARAMDGTDGLKPPALGATAYQMPHVPSIEFDSLMAMKESNPIGYQGAVDRMSAVGRLAFSRYAENKAAHERRAEEQRRAQKEDEQAEKERKALNKLRSEMGIPLE